MLWTFIVVLFILWLLGFFGRRRFRTGNWIHTLLVIVLILVILNLLHII